MAGINVYLKEAVLKQKYITYILLLALPFYFGCSSLKPINSESWSQLNSKEIETDEVFINTMDGNQYSLIGETIVVNNDTLSGNGFRIFVLNEVPCSISIPIKDIREIESHQFDLEATLILIGFISLFGFMFLLMGSDAMKSAATSMKF